MTVPLVKYTWTRPKVILDFELVKWMRWPILGTKEYQIKKYVLMGDYSSKGVGSKHELIPSWLCGDIHQRTSNYLGIGRLPS